MFVKRNSTTSELILTFSSLSAVSASREGLHMFCSCYRRSQLNVTSFECLSQFGCLLRSEFEKFKLLRLATKSRLQVDVSWTTPSGHLKSWCLMSQLDGSGKRLFRRYNEILTAIHPASQPRQAVSLRHMVQNAKQSKKQSKASPRWTWQKWTTLRSK